jgi:hypothetical protein
MPTAGWSTRRTRRMARSLRSARRWARRCGVRPAPTTRSVGWRASRIPTRSDSTSSMMLAGTARRSRRRPRRPRRRLAPRHRRPRRLRGPLLTRPAASPCADAQPPASPPPPRPDPPSTPGPAGRRRFRPGQSRRHVWVSFCRFCDVIPEGFAERLLPVVGGCYPSPRGCYPSPSFAGVLGGTASGVVRKTMDEDDRPTPEQLARYRAMTPVERLRQAEPPRGC